MTIYSIKYTFNDNTTTIERYINNLDNEKKTITYNELSTGKQIINREILKVENF